MTAVLALLLGAAGGGSSGFGGGGGGGFSGGGGGGGGAHGSGGSLSPLAVVVLVTLVVLFFLGAGLVAFVAERGRRRRRDERVRRVHAAAAEAADDDAAFASDVVEREAAAMFVAMQDAWSRDDREALARLCGSDLIVEWRRRLEDFARKGWTNRVKVLRGPDVFYVGLVNRAADAEDRVVVLVEATLRDVVADAQGHTIRHSGSSSEITSLKEYWTLAKDGDAWRLESIEQSAEGAHNLTGELVASPWGDRRIADEALVEGASADAVADDADIAGLVSLDYAGDARKAALDLSLVDGRFAPDVLEASARRAVAAWAEAVDGPDDALRAVASDDAVAALLYPHAGDRDARLVVRGPRLEAMTLERLDSDARPPTMRVSMRLEGARYVEDRDTAAVLEGSRDRRVRFADHWTFALDGADATPWRVVGHGDG